MPPNSLKTRRRTHIRHTPSRRSTLTEVNHEKMVTNLLPTHANCARPKPHSLFAHSLPTSPHQYPNACRHLHLSHQTVSLWHTQQSKHERNVPYTHSNNTRPLVIDIKILFLPFSMVSLSTPTSSSPSSFSFLLHQALILYIRWK